MLNIQRNVINTTLILCLSKLFLGQNYNQYLYDTGERLKTLKTISLKYLFNNERKEQNDGQNLLRIKINK